MKDMTTGSPVKILITFTIPILLGNLFQLTYTLADTRIIGTFLGDNALAAVGTVTVLAWLFMGFFIGMSNGFAIMTANRFGSKDLTGVRISFLTSLVLGISIVIVFIIIIQIAMNPLLAFLNVPDELLRPAGLYIRIYVAGLVITMIYNIFLASSRAIGDSITPLLTLILSVILNIAGDIILLGIFKTGVAGAAIATVISQTITLVICSIYLLKKYSCFRIRRSDFANLSREMCKNMLFSGLSMGLVGSLIGLGSMILQTSINTLGSSYIVAQSAARRVTDVLMSIFVATGTSIATYCSQNMGAGKIERIRLGIKAAYIITCTWCIFVIIIVYAISPLLIRLITDSSDSLMISAAVKYLKIDSILYVLVAIIFTLRNALQGIGDRVTPLISSGIEMAVKVILTYTLVPIMGYMGVILVEPIAWIIMVIPLIWRIKKWQS